MTLGDGAEWIWRRVADIEDTDSVHILDFCHTVDHLAEVCKLLHGHRAVRHAPEQSRARLRQDGAAVIDDLRQVRGAQRSHGDDMQREINYFEANRKRMNYQPYRNEHAPIGSSTVERACKHVGAERMKGSRMSCTLAGPQHMLQLRASIMSSCYARDHQHALPEPPQPAQPLAAA